MAGYDFRFLSSYDFECLSRDLLQKELGVTLESFKSGRDKGIDLRYSIPASSEKIIVQAKHYLESTYSTFFSSLKNKEAPKVVRLSPARYILTTSQGLTPPNKDAIKALFSPFCKSTTDIYGQDDLNALLKKFPEIEKAHFKLWLTSQAVLEKVLHSEIYTQTDCDLENIKKKIKRYVQNGSFPEAQRTLEDNHYCIIAGIPGIGKTTLAEMLLIAYLDKGYEAIKVSSDISEALKVYMKDKKQIFYYDDFLGQTTLKEKFNKNEDERILKFISAVKLSKHGRFLLTTREYILNQAKEEYERLSASGIDHEKCVIDLSKYSKFQRAKILFNHAYFSGISSDHMNNLLENKNYSKIINHQNYNPRIIEFMTEISYAKLIEAKDYSSEFLRNLNNSCRIWEHAFNRQISLPSQCMLLVLYSFSGEAFYEDLEKAFWKFYRNLATRQGQAVPLGAFKSSLKELEGTFISCQKDEFALVVKFHNPSVRDFLGNYFLENTSLIGDLIDTVQYFDQIQNLVGSFISPFTAMIIDVMKGISNKVILAMEGTLESESIALHPVWNGANFRKERNKVSAIGRHFFIYKVLEVMPSEHLSRILNKSWQIVKEEMKQGSSNKWLLTEFLGYVKGQDFKYINDTNDRLFLTKEYFLETFNEIQDFEHLITLFKQFDSLFSAKEFIEIREKYLHFLQQDVINVCEEFSSEELSTYRDSAEEIAHFFSADVKKEIRKLNIRCEILSLRESDRSDFDYESHRDQELDERYNDADIDQLFNSLKE